MPFVNITVQRSYYSTQKNARQSLFDINFLGGSRQSPKVKKYENAPKRGGFSTFFAASCAVFGAFLKDEALIFFGCFLTLGVLYLIIN